MPGQDTAVADVERAIVDLATAQSYVELQDYIVSSPQPAEVIINAIWALLNIPHVRGAYVVAKLLHMRGIVSPVISFALFFGGRDTNKPEDVKSGRRLLHAQYETYPDETKKIVYSALEPLLLNQVSLAFADADYTAKMLHILDLLKQVIPDFRERFDLDAPPVLFDMEAARAAGGSRARLIDFKGPADASDATNSPPRRERHAIVAFREFVFPHFVNSRKLEQGQTLVAALNNYGWRAQFLGIQFNKHEIEDTKAIVAACLAEKPDVLIMDAVILNFPTPFSLITQLRETLPNLKIVGMYFDAWSSQIKQLHAQATILDVMWTVSPDLPMWKEPAFANRVVQFPLPRGGDFAGPVLPLDDSMHFNGGVAAYNWHRALWLASMRTVGLPITTHLAAFLDDGLEPLESYQAFMRRLADGRCGINFSMRQNMTTMSVTARSFEILAVGSLLVQERCPEMDCYIVEGEHYLGFSSVADLRGVRAFIAEKPEEAERVRRRGYKFFRARYHDDKLIGYLDHAIYGA